MIKTAIFSTLFLCASPRLFGQNDYRNSALRHRQAYKEEFVTDAHSPLTAADTGFLRFFPIDPAYVCRPRLTIQSDAVPFLMSTHSGTTKRYVEYAMATIDLPWAGRNGRRASARVHIYRSADAPKDTAYRDHLFLPFYDLTNGNETYGGGRYLDLSIRDIKDGFVTIDFNKAYNMYCAYTDGYACPIPPEENRLKLRIPAGEKLFGKPAAED